MQYSSSKSVQNPLVENNPKDLPTTIYTEEDRVYLTYLQNRLENARRQKINPYPEFGGKTYYQIYNENEKIANTVLDPKKNEDDVIVSAGTVESKLDALLSNINNLDIGPDVFAFDKENARIQELGEALEDIIEETEKLDGEGGDEEKKQMRQRELLKQGTVFVQEEWLKIWETKKKLKESYNGKFKDFTGWESEEVLTFDGPSRTLLHGPNVFLGNITEYFMERQPFMFVIIHKDFNWAKTKYGKFENFQYVKSGAVPTDTVNSERTIYDNKWRLTEVTENQVEIVLYQDKPNDEFQIIINGVALLPIGFPLSAVSPRGDYNIVKQIYRPINSNFAYGKSFVSAGAVKEVSALIDEMLKLFVLKTRKSFSPSYINTSGRVISRKVLSPGRITMGIAPDSLHAIGTESQGVTSSEFGVLEKLQELVDKNTVSNQFAGQQGHAGTTATEVVELQRQAKLVLGLTIAACGLLEKKLAYLRLYNILTNWFNPIDTKVVQIGDIRKEINQYRAVQSDATVKYFGQGERHVMVTDQALPDHKTIRKQEIEMEKEKGHPVQLFYISPEGLADAKLRWYIVINPKEKETSSFYKMLFREEITDMTSMMNLGSMPNKDGLEEKFARVYGENKTKVFNKSSPPIAAGVGGQGGQGQPVVPGSPVDANGGSARKIAGRSNLTGAPA